MDGTNKSLQEMSTRARKGCAGVPTVILAKYSMFSNVCSPNLVKTLFGTLNSGVESQGSPLTIIGTTWGSGRGNAGTLLDMLDFDRSASSSASKSPSLPGEGPKFGEKIGTCRAVALTRRRMPSPMMIRPLNIVINPADQ